jgi:hypothetical protein
MKITPIIISWILTIYFGSIVFARQKLPFENGRYFEADSGIIIKGQAILFFTVLTIIFLLTSLFLTYKFFIKENKK